MIIDIYCQGDTVKELPLFSTSGYVAVSNIVIEFETQMPRGLIILTSNLVSQSSTNPLQQIGAFYHEGQSKFASYQPTRLMQYKMNCLNSFESFIKVQQEKNQEKKVKDIYIQLIVSNERIF